MLPSLSIRLWMHHPAMPRPVDGHQCEKPPMTINPEKFDICRASRPASPLKAAFAVALNGKRNTPTHCAQAANLGSERVLRSLVSDCRQEGLAGPRTRRLFPVRLSHSRTSDERPAEAEAGLESLTQPSPRKRDGARDREREREREREIYIYI